MDRYLVLALEGCPFRSWKQNGLMLSTGSVGNILSLLANFILIPAVVLSVVIIFRRIRFGGPLSRLSGK
jgi:hypothetical protein